MIVANVGRPQIPPKSGNFTLNLRTGSVPSNYANSEYMTWLQDMKTFFERAVYSNGGTTLQMDVYFRALSDGTLAQCGPGDGGTNFLQIINDVDVYNNMLARPNRSTMAFNTNYYKEPPVTADDRAWKRQFFGTALHECFHGLGLGSLWNGPFRILVDNSWSTVLGTQVIPDVLLSSIFPWNVVGTGNPTNPRYTATYARADYRSEMGQISGGVWSNTESGVGYIPIENRGMGSHTTINDAGGTALAHWRGSYGGTLSGIVNRKGQDSINENFTSWSSRNEGVNRWIGSYTLGALRDLNYSVDYSAINISIHDWKRNQRPDGGAAQAEFL